MNADARLLRYLFIAFVWLFEHVYQYELLHEWNLWLAIYSSRFMRIINTKFSRLRFSFFFTFKYSMLVYELKATLVCALLKMYRIISFRVWLLLCPLYLVQFKCFHMQYMYIIPPFKYTNNKQKRIFGDAKKKPKNLWIMVWWKAMVVILHCVFVLQTWNETLASAMNHSFTLHQK